MLQKLSPIGELLSYGCSLFFNIYFLVLEATVNTKASVTQASRLLSKPLTTSHWQGNFHLLLDEWFLTLTKLNWTLGRCWEALKQRMVKPEPTAATDSECEQSPFPVCVTLLSFTTAWRAVGIFHANYWWPKESIRGFRHRTSFCKSNC